MITIANIVDPHCGAMAGREEGGRGECCSSYRFFITAYCEGAPGSAVVLTYNTTLALWLTGSGVGRSLS